MPPRTATDGGAHRDAPLFVRATEDLVTQLGAALTDFLVRTVTLTTGGCDLSIDPRAATRHVGGALAQDPALYGRLVAALGAALPYSAGADYRSGRGSVLTGANRSRWIYSFCTRRAESSARVFVAPMTAASLRELAGGRRTERHLPRRRAERRHEVLARAGCGLLGIGRRARWLWALDNGNIFG